jgi:hypothetical protein
MRTRRKKKELEEVLGGDAYLCLLNSYLQQNPQYEEFVIQFVQVQTNEDDELYFKNYQALCNRCSIMRRRRIIKLFAIAAS